MKYLFLVMLVGCASPTMVELSAPLPTHTIGNKVILPQSYHLTVQDRNLLMKGIAISSSEMDASIDKYWMDSWGTLSLINHTQKELVEKMNEAETLQEFNKYKKLFLECKYLHGVIMDDSIKVKEQLEVIRQEY